MRRWAKKFCLTIAVALFVSHLTPFNSLAAEAPTNTVNEELQKKIAENSPEMEKPVSAGARAAASKQPDYKFDKDLSLGVKIAIGAHRLADPGQVSNSEAMGSSWELFKSEVWRRQISAGVGIFIGKKIGDLFTLQQEIWVKGRQDHRADFSGAGRADTTTYFRNTLTAPAVATFGWSNALGIRGLRPYALGGIYGERILGDAQKFHGYRGTHIEDIWKEAPAEDWGWVYGGGIHYKEIGLEWLVEEGQKDLDPSGPQPLKTRSAWLVIVGGWQ